jgi:Phosphodiester glycosidase
MRKVLLAILLSGAFAAPAQAFSQQLMPGVTYTKQVLFTVHGPVGLHVITAPRPGGLYDLKPMLSDGVLTGRERVTSMQKRAGVAATVAGINGDFFHARLGYPFGILMQDGLLKRPPLSTRSSIGIGADGRLSIRRMAFFGFWQGIGQRRPLVDVNEVPLVDGVSLFTPDWGVATPPTPNAVEAVVNPFPRVVPGNELVGPVIQVNRGGGTPIPPTGAVFLARGAGANRLAQEAIPGQRMSARLVLQPGWPGVTDALGGGPVLVRNRRPVFRAYEDFVPRLLALRDARAAVGQRADGTILLVAVDGRQPGYSVGVTNFELAQTMVRLGAVTASGLDSGGSVTMASEGTLLNRPADRSGERPVAEGLFVFYYGVNAPPPALATLSPNRDGVDERQMLTYKVVSPSVVTASIVGPDGRARLTQTGPRPPGTYKVSWSGLKADNTSESEGRWRWTVTAVDGLGRRSTADQVFWLNNTLGFLRVTPLARVRAGRRFVVASFRLIRPAEVTAAVETRNGVVLRRIVKARLRAGRHKIVWNGRVGKRGLIYSGRYVVRVSAQNGFGPASLAGLFVTRR